MRRLLTPGLLLAAGALVPLAAAAAGTNPISDVSVTVYRAQHSGTVSLDLDGLQGFALVTETRTVSIPAGESRLRFEGVADGIEPQSAIITGLPTDVLEKNHDAHVLSPMELVAATLGRNVWLVRTERKTGKSQSVAGTLIADNDGVLFKGPAGIEALRCSGLPETFHFDTAVAAANAKPTLSVLVRSPAPSTATVRLSYLAHGFDWMANYTATVAADGKSLDLGAWVTLANSNATSFPQAHTQVVAGRLNRESNQVEPIQEQGPEIVANCWPQGTTSDPPEEPDIPGARPLDGHDTIMVTAMRKSELSAVMPMAAMAPMQADAVMVEQEQLGDLKLYRVPDRTSVSSRQIKQVRLLDRKAVPFELIYDTVLQPFMADDTHPLEKVLRMRNDSAHHLGLPLPSGQVAAFYQHDGTPLLVGETPLRDVALDEEFELRVGVASDLQVRSTTERRTLAADSVKEVPLIPGVDIRSAQMDAVHAVEITNARSTPAVVELRLAGLRDGTQVVRADKPPFMHNGYQTFRITVPAEGSATFRYQTAHTTFTPVPR